MANVDKTLFVASGVAGVLGVALGAFGAHGLRDYFASLADGEARRRLWETAAHYHLLHAVAVGVAASLARNSVEPHLGIRSGDQISGGAQPDSALARSGAESGVSPFREGAAATRKEGAATVAFTAGLSFLAGITLFSGSLYAMALTGIGALGAITPFGGVAFIAGWTSIAVAAFRLR